MAIAYIGIGSNLDDPQSQVSQALDHISRLPETQLTTCSRWYQSKAVGPGSQPDYINGALQISTALSPQQLLTALQHIENLQGRVRLERWGARTLDLDILMYDKLCLASETLTLPHPRIGERNFVLLPLQDIDPQLILPDGSTLKSLLEKCSTEGIVALS